MSARKDVMLLVIFTSLRGAIINSQFNFVFLRRSNLISNIPMRLLRLSLLHFVSSFKNIGSQRRRIDFVEIISSFKKLRDRNGKPGEDLSKGSVPDL